MINGKNLRLAVEQKAGGWIWKLEEFNPREGWCPVKEGHGLAGSRIEAFAECHLFVLAADREEAETARADKWAPVRSAIPGSGNVGP